MSLNKLDIKSNIIGIGKATGEAIKQTGKITMHTSALIAGVLAKTVRGIKNSTQEQRNKAKKIAKIALLSSVLLWSGNEKMKKYSVSPYFDNQEFHTFYEKGQMSMEEKFKHTEIIGNGVMIVKDAGMSFYVVQKGETTNDIRAKLADTDEFAYIGKLSKLHIKSFNIYSSELTKDFLLPIPLDPSIRASIDDNDIIESAIASIRLMYMDPVYGKVIKQMVDDIGERQMANLMFAVAHHESANNSVWHRWEPALKSFSFSMYYILMDKKNNVLSPGLKARQNLNMTEGQTMHPVNAGKLFLGYIIEKANENRNINPTELMKAGLNDQEKFAKYYNGKYWRKYNPKYAENIKEGVNIAENMSDIATKVFQKDKGEEKIVIIKKNQLEKTVYTNYVSTKNQYNTSTRKNINETINTNINETINTNINETEAYNLNPYRGILGSLADANYTSENKPIKTDNNLKKIGKRLKTFLNKMYGNAKIYKTDSIIIGVDKKTNKLYIRFQRGEHSSHYKRLNIG